MATPSSFVQNNALNNVRAQPQTTYLRGGFVLPEPPTTYLGGTAPTKLSHVCKNGDAMWFEDRNVSYNNVDYASTMWRPDLRPLPCSQSVRHTTGADGQHSFSVLAKLPAGTLLEISLCVKMSLNVVDQFPVLWDFVLFGATTQTVCTREDAEVCWPPSILV